MAGPTVPPQAYTRDTLVQAYEWLKLQPPAVKERATSADTLISLYFQAKRYPHLPLTQSPPSAQSNAAPSSQAFAADLKNLAENIRQFEAEDAGAGESTVNFVEPKPIEPKPELRATHENLAPPKPIIQTPVANGSPGFPSANTVSTEKMSMAPHPGPGQTRPSPTFSSSLQDSLQDLDPTTRELLRSAQLRLNLSSEGEALRVLVILGSEKLRLLDRD